MAKSVKMVAIGTVRRGVMVEPAASEADPRTGRVRVIPAVTKREEIAPGQEFDATEAERDALVASGAARLATKEVPIESEQIPVAPNTAPRLPASGETVEPDPNEVATETKPSDPNHRDRPVVGGSIRRGRI